jgi:hypothetical protein
MNARLLFFATDNLSSAANPIVVKGFDYPKGEQPENFRFSELPNKALEDDIAVLYTENPIGLQAMPLLSPPPLVDDIARGASKVTFVGFGLNPSPTTLSRASGIKREATGPISTPTTVPSWSRSNGPDFPRAAATLVDPR